MKTRSLIIAALGILTLVLIFYCEDTGTPNNTICSNYSDMSTLEVRLIHAMTKKYKETQFQAINDGTRTRFRMPTSQEPQMGDSRAIWFDLETLKAFIHQIEIKAKNNSNSIPSTDLGVRIYYASYPELRSWGNFPDLPGNGSNVLTPDYEERHTVIMVPTIRRNGVEEDFNPLNPTTFSQSLSTFSSYSSGSRSQILALSGIPDSGSAGAQNHGGLYPPRNESGMGF